MGNRRGAIDESTQHPVEWQARSVETLSTDAGSSHPAPHHAWVAGIGSPPRSSAGGSQLRGLPPGGGLVRHSATVQALAAGFSAADLAAAAVLSRNPQDFDGRPLPSGQSIASATAPSVDDSAAVPSRSAEMAGLPPEYVEAQFDANETLARCLSTVGLTVLRNDGETLPDDPAYTVARKNMCLVMAFLQQSGIRLEDVPALAHRVQPELAARSDALGLAVRRGQGIHSSPANIKALAEYVFYGADNVPPLLFMTAGPDGAPLLFDPTAGPDDEPPDLTAISHRTLLFAEWPGHVEAVANPSGRPLSTVLAQLQAAMAAPDDACRVHAIRREMIRSARPLSVSIGGVEQDWKRGAQTALHWPDIERDQNPVRLAREMAEAQGVFDDAFAALTRWTSVETGRAQTADDGEVVRLVVSDRLDYAARTLDVRRDEAGNLLMEPVYVPSTDHQGLPQFPYGLQRGDIATQYEIDVALRRGRVLSMTVRSSGDGDVTAEFDHPWGRDWTTLMSTRKPLTLPNELDAFDEYSATRQSKGERARHGSLPTFMTHLREKLPDQTWDVVEAMDEAEREIFFRRPDVACLGDVHMREVRQYFEPNRPKVPSVQSRMHPDDRPYFNDFSARAEPNDLKRYGQFLNRLRRQNDGPTWASLMTGPPDQMKSLLSSLPDALRMAVSRAADPTLPKPLKRKSTKERAAPGQTSRGSDAASPVDAPGQDDVGTTELAPTP